MQSLLLHDVSVTPQGGRLLRCRARGHFNLLGGGLAPWRGGDNKGVAGKITIYYCVNAAIIIITGDGGGDAAKIAKRAPRDIRRSSRDSILLCSSIRNSSDGYMGTVRHYCTYVVWWGTSAAPKTPLPPPCQRE